MLRIGIIVGSLSSTSINRAVANTLPSVAPDGVEFVYLDFSALPFYSQDAEANFPAEARAWKNSIAAVDGVIIVTPEYSRSLPGSLKNALDWAARPYLEGSFNGKPVSIMGVSGGPVGTAVVQQHLRAILGHYNAPTLGQPETFIRFNAEDYVADEIVGEATRGMLERFVTATVKHVELYAREFVSA